jgi:hypothetical protein
MESYIQTGEVNSRVMFPPKVSKRPLYHFNSMGNLGKEIQLG